MTGMLKVEYILLLTSLALFLKYNREYFYRLSVVKKITVKNSLSSFNFDPVEVAELKSYITERSIRVEIDDLENYGKIKIKRFYDVVFSLLALLLVCSWLFPVVAALIKLTSKGPVFFKQVRKGKNGVNFNIYKFRTMTHNARQLDENGFLIQAYRYDNRVTKLGAFLRKTSLDEFPQFINVLKGDMSLIGPRPHPIELDKKFENDIFEYNDRYLVKPGLSGWAQINGHRGATPARDSMKERVEKDIWYIKNWSLKLDLKISFLTFFSLIKGDVNAY